MDDKNGHKVYQLSPNYVKRTIAGQHVLVSIGEGLADFRGYIQLNESAAFLWDQLQEGKTKEELVRALTEEYDVDEDAAGRDIDKSLDLLLAKGMIL